MSNGNPRAAIVGENGTSAEGSFGVTDVLVFSRDFDQEALLQYAASADTISELSIAHAISDSSRQRLSVEGFQSSRSNGASGGAASKWVEVVCLGFLREQGIAVDYARVEPLMAQGRTVVFVLVDGRLKGAIALAEIALPRAKPALSARGGSLLPAGLS